MAKFILFLLALALVSAGNSKIRGAGASEAGDDDGDMQQRRETMAEVRRVFSNPVSAAAADSDTVHRAAAFLQREMGPLGPIIRAISKMPESSAAEVRTRDEAFDAAKELLMRHFRKLGSGKTADDDDDLAQRQQAMAEVVRFSKSPSADAGTIHRLASFLKREMGPIETIAILRAIRKMPENSADEVRIKNEAFDAGMDWVSGHLRLLLPHGCAACATTDDATGFAVSDMLPENSGTAEVRSKEEKHAALKEMMSRHLDGELFSGGSVKFFDDDM